MNEVWLIETTVANEPDARRIAQALVEQRLAACVQVIGPVASTYVWQGNVEHAEEWLCRLKTTAERYAEVETSLRALHPYEVPEIVATPIVAGWTEYLSWLRQNVEKKRSGRSDE